jgi:hypothetical protein
VSVPPMLSLSPKVDGTPLLISPHPACFGLAAVTITLVVLVYDCVCAVHGWLACLPVCLGRSFVLVSVRPFVAFCLVR